MVCTLPGIEEASFIKRIRPLLRGIATSMKAAKRVY
jgi:hypothetical protein